MDLSQSLHDRRGTKRRRLDEGLDSQANQSGEGSENSRLQRPTYAYISSDTHLRSPAAEPDGMVQRPCVPVVPPSLNMAHSGVTNFPIQSNFKEISSSQRSQFSRTYKQIEGTAYQPQPTTTWQQAGTYSCPSTSFQWQLNNNIPPLASCLHPHVHLQHFQNHSLIPFPLPSHLYDDTSFQGSQIPQQSSEPPYATGLPTPIPQEMTNLSMPDDSAFAFGAHVDEAKGEMVCFGMVNRTSVSCINTC